MDKYYLPAPKLIFGAHSNRKSTPKEIRANYIIYYEVITALFWPKLAAGPAQCSGQWYQ